MKPTTPARPIEQVVRKHALRFIGEEAFSSKPRLMLLEERILDAIIEAAAKLEAELQAERLRGKDMANTLGLFVDFFDGDDDERPGICGVLEQARAALTAHSEEIHKAGGPLFTVNGKPSPETAKAIGEMVKCAANADAQARVTQLENALKRYVEWHGPCFEAHPSEATEEDRQSEQWIIDQLVNAALTARAAPFISTKSSP